MKTKAALAVLILSATGSLAVAQGRYGRSARVNLTQTQTITGEISAVDIAYCAQYPSITVNEAVIKVAPLWFLLDQGFELKVGDQVTVLAASCDLPGDSYLYAIQITNHDTSATLTLRDASGFPLWSNFGGHRPLQRAQAAGGRSGIDPASVRTITGTVERVNFGVGLQMPVLVVKTSSGTLVTMKIGPERVLLAADFELNPGEMITATVATCLRNTVALQLTNAAGVTVVLRNADGTPNWN